eukprot:3275102-Rhodomonas_salina.1
MRGQYRTSIIRGAYARSVPHVVWRAYKQIAPTPRQYCASHSISTRYCPAAFAMSVPDRA